MATRRFVTYPVFAVLLLALTSCFGSQDGTEVAQQQETQEAPAMDMDVSHARSEMHGGSATVTAAHHFEVVYLADGIRVYVYDAEENPVGAEGMAGTVALEYSDGEPRTADLVYHAAGRIGEGAQALPTRDYLFAGVDLSGAGAQPVGAMFALSGVAGEQGESVQFAVPFTGLVERPFMCPMHADVWGETDKSECPVCGGMYTAAPRTQGL